MCVTTIGTRKQVLVYDSWYTKWDESALSLLQKQFHCSPSYLKTQGVIVNATSIAFGKDPLKWYTMNHKCVAILLIVLFMERWKLCIIYYISISVMI